MCSAKISLAMTFNEIKFRINTSLGLMGGCIPCIPPVSVPGLKVSAIRERPVQRYSGVLYLGSEQKGRVSILKLTFGSRFASLLRWKAAETVFVVLSFGFQVWRYSPTVAISLLSNPSTACQSVHDC